MQENVKYWIINFDETSLVITHSSTQKHVGPLLILVKREYGQF